MIHIDRLVNAQGNAYLGRTRVTNDATGKFVDLREGVQPDQTTIGQLRYFLEKDSISEGGHQIVSAILTKLGAGTVAIDYKQLSAELAPLIEGLTEEDLDRIADYVNDDAARRLTA